ncbi:MAG: AI-2E family transporter [Gammaproteobacteria bacterium]|nr:AI-2E family transporter [Gammaproteobacteria bacterium]
MGDSRAWFYLTAGLIACGLLYLLAPILTPFVVAALLAYLGDPLVDRLERWRLSRTLAVTVVFLVLFLSLALVVLLLVPLLEGQIAAFVQKLPKYLDWVSTRVVPWVQHTFGVEAGTLDMEMAKQAVLNHWKEAGGVAAWAMKSVSTSGMALAGWLTNLLLIPVVTFYLLRDWDHLVARIHDLLPRHIEPAVSTLARESDETLGAFLRGQLSVMVALGTVYSVGLWLIGLEFALLIGMLAGVVSFVPYLGFIVGMLVAGVAMYLQAGELLPLVWVLAVFGVGQLLESVVFTPLLVGDRIGLHPVAVIFAVLAGGQLFGFFGVLLALPVAAVLVVIMRHADTGYRASRFYRDPEAPGG